MEKLRSNRHQEGDEASFIRIIRSGQGLSGLDRVVEVAINWQVHSLNTAGTC